MGLGILFMGGFNVGNLVARYLEADIFSGASYTVVSCPCFSAV